MENEIYQKVKSYLETYSDVSTEEQKKIKLQLLETELSRNMTIITGQEQVLLNYLCNLEASTALMSIGDSQKRQIKEKLGIKTLEEEMTFFIKTFIRDYLSNVTGNSKVILKDDLNAGRLFNDFASKELKRNKEFCRTILTLDGRYMPYMEENFRNNNSLMQTAIANDTSLEVESFTVSDTSLKTNPALATLYLQKRKELNGYHFQPEYIYKEILKQEEGSFPTTIFKKQEQKEWLKSSSFLVNLAKLDAKFVDYIVSGEIPMNLVESKTGVNQYK